MLKRILLQTSSSTNLIFNRCLVMQKHFRTGYAETINLLLTSSSKFIHPHAIATCVFCPFSQELKQCSCCAHASHCTTLRNLCGVPYHLLMCFTQQIGSCPTVGWHESMRCSGLPCHRHADNTYNGTIWTCILCQCLTGRKMYQQQTAEKHYDNKKNKN